MHHLPYFIDVFIQPIRDNQIAQVAFVAVLILIGLDIIFGVVTALAKHEYSSEKMRNGIAHKCSEFGLLMVALVVDGLIVGGVDIGFSSPVFVASCVYLALMEIASLLEIICRSNPQLADSPLFKLLEQGHVIAAPESENDEE